MKVIKFIIYIPIAFIVCIFAWLVSFFPIVLATPFQSFIRIVKGDKQNSLDKQVSKSIQKACQTISLSNENKSSDKDKGGN